MNGANRGNYIFWTRSETTFSMPARSYLNPLPSTAQDRLVKHFSVGFVFLLQFFVAKVEPGKTSETASFLNFMGWIE